MTKLQRAGGGAGAPGPITGIGTPNAAHRSASTSSPPAETFSDPRTFSGPRWIRQFESASLGVLDEKHMLTKVMMAEFEELIDGQMDHLYAGALFMTGGDAEQAEELLLDTVTWASGTYREQPPDSDHRRWMDGILAQRLLVLVVAPSRVPPDNDPLLFAAGTLSLPARAALWLTLICRWSYRDTAHVLSLSRAQLVELLSSRHTLYSAISSEDADDRNQETGWPKSRSGAR